MSSHSHEARDALTVFATYRLSAEAEERFLPMLKAHWPTLSRLGLVEEQPPQVFRSQAGDRVTFVEIFTWKPGAAERAHTHPEVAAIWEPMGTVLTPDGALPPMDFPHYARYQ